MAWVLRNSIFVLFIAIATLALSVYLYVIVPKGFFPQQDTGRLGGNIVADQAISFPGHVGPGEAVWPRSCRRIRDVESSLGSSPAAAAARGLIPAACSSP